ncbi:MAG: hypothetical protein DCO96_03300 [Fluviicola sp. XM-24bin1]|jgi:hypothetical protein|nr:MAG: hypothetical protein DCO96_03300 [Fluviicola sp. XM-24bin1]
MADGYQNIIKVQFSGAHTDAELYTGLAVQTIAILVGGIILWRISNYMHKRKQKQRRKNEFFETPYAKGWKRK